MFGVEFRKKKINASYLSCFFISRSIKKLTLLTGLVLVLSLHLPAQVFEFYEPISRFQADRAALERKYSLKETQEYYERITIHLNEWLAYLGAVDYDALTYDGKLDYILFRNHIEKAQFFHRINEEDFHRVGYVTDFADGLYEFVRDRRRGKTVSGQAEARLFHQSAQQFRDASVNLTERPPFSSWLEADKAAEVVKDFRENVAESWRFYFGYHPEFTWWTETAFKELEESMKAYEENLRGHFSNLSAKDDGSGVVGRPEGRQALIKRLQYEFIPYSPEELSHIANFTMK